MEKSRVNALTAFALSFVLSLSVATMISCGGSSSPTSATTGTVNVSMTDPATCTFAFTGGVWVTVTKVTANISGNAGPDGSGWQPLVDLTKSPMQVNLLSLADPTSVCLLKSLGASGPLPPGKYQQIRLYLLSNNPGAGVAVPSSNHCGNSAGWNCVVTGTDQKPIYSELQLPSEVQTGIKIPSSHITSGGLTVTAGQSVDLNIDFQSCASIVQEGNQQYRLKPVLFAGEVTKNMNSISGQVVDSTTSKPVAGATVLFEHPSGSTETIMDSTTTDSNGDFFVCPLQGANYDIVVAAQTGTLGTNATTYNPTVAFDVPLGTNLKQIPLVPEASSSAATGGAATIAGQVDTESQAETVTLTPTMSITPTGGSATDVAIPVFSVNGSAAPSQPPAVMTTSSPGTPACTVSGGDCNNFSLAVPASNPNVGTFSSGAISYAMQSSSSVIYSVTASSEGCSGGDVTEMTPSTGVTADSTTTLSPSLSLTSCQ